MKKYIVNSLIAVAFLSSCSLQSNTDVPATNSDSSQLWKTEPT